MNIQFGARYSFPTYAEASRKEEALRIAGETKVMLLGDPQDKDGKPSVVLTNEGLRHEHTYRQARAFVQQFWKSTEQKSMAELNDLYRTYSDAALADYVRQF